MRFSSCAHSDLFVIRQAMRNKLSCIMDKRQGGVVLNRKKPVWDAQEDPRCNPAKFADEEPLRVPKKFALNRLLHKCRPAMCRCTLAPTFKNF